MSIIRNGLDSIDLDVPVVLPTLNLDFANSQSLDERITFSRGSIGTFVNKNGLISIASTNEPRFDYDPVTGECKGLLIEESRQNLLQYSEQFDNAVWIKSAYSIQPNVITAPDGNTTADKLVENTSSTTHNIYYQITLPSTTSYTFSVFLKAGERTWVDVRGYNATNGNQFIAKIDLINGIFLSNTSGTVRLDKYPNGWWRFSGVGSFNNIYTQFFISTIIRNNNASDTSYSGNGTSGIYAWGAQLETGAFPTSYIPTGASTVTRSADVPTMTGTNFSSWYNQTESTIFCEFNAYQLMSTVQRNVFNISGPEPLGLNRIQIQLNGLGGGGTTQPIYHNFYQNGPNFVDYFGFPYTTGPTKNIMRYKDLDMVVVSKDGNLRRANNTPRTFTVPLTKTMNALGFGTFNGAISRFAYYPKALNDAEIQYLTQ